MQRFRYFRADLGGKCFGGSELSEYKDAAWWKSKEQFGDTIDRAPEEKLGEFSTISCGMRENSDEVSKFMHFNIDPSDRIVLNSVWTAPKKQAR